MSLLPTPDADQLRRLKAEREARAAERRCKAAEPATLPLTLPAPDTGRKAAKRGRAPRQRERVPTEKEVQHAVRRLLASIGARVWDTSQPFRAKITPGLPDILAFIPRRGLVFIECKRPGGKQSPAQVEFQAECEAAGVPYVLGGVAELQSFLNTTRGEADRAAA